MFREMRRSKQQLSHQETVEILRQGTSGVLALAGEDGYPYAVPLSYVYDSGKIWFHGAVAGHKLDAIRQHDKASFCVIGQDQVLPEKLTTCYRSVIAFGRVRVLEDKEEIRNAAQVLGDKYNPGQAEEVSREIGRDMPRLRMFQLDIEHMTGKEGIELTRARKQEG